MKQNTKLNLFIEKVVNRDSERRYNIHEFLCMVRKQRTWPICSACRPNL